MEKMNERGLKMGSKAAVRNGVWYFFRRKGSKDTWKLHRICGKTPDSVCVGLGQWVNISEYDFVFAGDNKVQAIATPIPK